MVIITYVFLTNSCGALAVARTVLTGELNAQSDITCTFAILEIQHHSNRNRTETVKQMLASPSAYLLCLSPLP